MHTFRYLIKNVAKTFLFCNEKNKRLTITIYDLTATNPKKCFFFSSFTSFWIAFIVFLRQKRIRDSKSNWSMSKQNVSPRLQQHYLWMKDCQSSQCIVARSHAIIISLLLPRMQTGTNAKPAVKVDFSLYRHKRTKHAIAAIRPQHWYTCNRTTGADT